jgi:hypothetical protein
VNYAQPVWPRNPEALQHLRDLVDTASQSLLEPELQRDGLDIFRDILESYTSFFQATHMQNLGVVVTEHIGPRLVHMLQDGDPECLPLGQMVIAYGVANIETIVERPDTSPLAASIVQLHFNILTGPGYPGDEDELSILSIEFWNTYVEYVNDTVFSKDADEQSPLWLPQARVILSQLVQHLWGKMVTPPSEVAKQWTDAENEGFKEFRLDATDLMLSIFVALGKQMLEQLASLTLELLGQKQWRAVEAALFCLNTLADNVLEDQVSEDILASVFSSSLFREIGDFTQSIPQQTRRTAIDILGSYGPYIEKHAEYLPDTIRFLFASLESSGFAYTAAKSIAALCSACRSSLTTELPGFLQQYQTFLNGQTSDSYTKEKVIGAIAAIVQALKPESAKVEPLLALISNVERDVQSAKDYAAAGDTTLAEVVGVDGLNCLAAIGKNMQVPEDIPINIYDDDEDSTNRADFWDGADARKVKDRIMGCFSVLQVLGNDGDAIEAACQVLKSGFAETEPGPFVMPPSVTVSFLQQCSIHTPQLESVLQAVCILITQHSKSASPRIPTDVSDIIDQVGSFVQQLGQPSQDPGVAQGCIDVFCRLLPYYIELLFVDSAEQRQRLSNILDFTLKAIEGQDVFPKRSSADFWTRLIKPPSPIPSESARRSVEDIIAAYGPQLSLTLMTQIGGAGQRSELDHLCEPLKALVTAQPAARQWVEGALASEKFAAGTDRVSDVEKRRFVQQLFGVRGDSRKTKDLVREFYAACRGTVVSFS